jgi:hypothetical protein
MADHHLHLPEEQRQQDKPEPARHVQRKRQCQHANLKIKM